MPDANNLENRVGEAQPKNLPTEKARSDTAYDPFNLTGQVVGGVLLEKSKGKGGMGVVYEGTFIKTKQKAILKVLRPEHLDNKEIVDRFLEDPKTRENLSHPNLVKPLAYGIDEIRSIADNNMMRKIPFIADELVEGANDLTRVPLNVEQGAFILSQVAEALQYLHSNDIIHRDIKPANIIVNKNLHAFLIDFGTKKSLDDETDRTLHGEVFGTVDYLAPEQAKSAKEVVPESDLYSLACTAYNIHSKRPPKEQRTSHLSSQAQVSNDVTQRMNVQVLYEVWLNEAIEMKRSELTQDLISDDERKVKYAQSLLKRITPVSWQYERLIMMVLEAKDPKDRPPVAIWSEKLDYLINKKLLAPRELTADEKKNIEQLERKAKMFKEAPDAVKDDLKNRQNYVQTLEELIDWVDDLDKRAVLVTDAFDAYASLHVNWRTTGAASKKNKEEYELSLTKLDDRIQWLKSCQNFQHAIKKRSELKQIQKDVPQWISAARKGLEESNYVAVSENYAKIDPTKIPEEIKQDFARLTEEIVQVVRAELGACKEEPYDPETKRFKRAKQLVEVITSPDVKREVESFFVHHVQEKAVDQLKRDYLDSSAKKDYDRMLDCAERMEKCIDGLAEDRKPVVRAVVDEYLASLKDKRDDITFIRGLHESTGNLQKDFNKDVLDYTEAGIPAEKIETYRKAIEDKLRKLESINKENVGPKYHDLKIGLTFFKEDIHIQEIKRGVAAGKFEVRLGNLTSLIKIYNERGDIENEKLYILLQKKQLETRLDELPKK